MKNFNIIKSLIGESVTKEDLKCVDCYVHNNFGLFIPSTGFCGYAQKKAHTHPSYMITIEFLKYKDEESIIIKENQYLGNIFSPNVPHSDSEENNYYCILIDKIYFEEQYKLYSNDELEFNETKFAICSDILKALNTFAFEYSKEMKNSHITLNAQATLITHWIIRSLLGETYDMRGISSNYSIARVEQYIEQHYSEHITVEELAKLINMSSSNFNRIFKKELKMTPIEYLIETRIEKSKLLLRRKEIPITEIAIRCGFNSSSHFSACFNKLLNTTPSEFRGAYFE